MADKSVSTRDELIRECIREEHIIGQGLERLFRELPGGGLEHVAHAFQGASVVSRREQRHLSKCASALVAPLLSQFLIPHGLTPFRLFYAFKNVPSLIERLRHAGVLLKQGPIPFMEDSTVASSFTKEVIQVARCKEEVAKRCYRVLRTVLYYSPRFLPGLHAMWTKGELALESCPDNTTSWADRLGR